MPLSVGNSVLVATMSLIAAPFAIYSVFLGISTVPYFQRHFLYAHKFNTLFLYDVNNPEYWGFSKNQVTPFYLHTTDGEDIYAWHIMPLPLYLKHERAISEQPVGLSQDFIKTEAFRILKSDPKSKLVISFHGNAGHIAQAIRPDSYHALTDTSSYHVLAIDYRGFGHSSGAPTEQGLIQDATTLLEWTMNELGIPPQQIVLLGQSLGTAVASGVAEKYAIQGIEFAGIVLVAGFSELATMISGYRILGLIPLTGPFGYWPAFMRALERFVVDKWHSADRLGNIVRHTHTRLRLNILHAKNDKDIPWTEDNKLFMAAANEIAGGLDDAEFEAQKEQRTIHKGKDAFVTTWKSEPDMIIRQELIRYGGHNGIMGASAVMLAIMRSFDFEGTTYA